MIYYPIKKLLGFFFGGGSRKDFVIGLWIFFLFYFKQWGLGLGIYERIYSYRI